jgi:isoquinoline 1-oxidoreductase beta subunit
MGFLDNPFDIPHFRAENGPAPAHVRIGWLRSVANLYHAFGIQSFIDECACAAGKDPIEYWLGALGAPRIFDVASQHAKLDSFVKTPQNYPLDTGKLRSSGSGRRKSGWAQRKTGDGRAWGFAAHRAVLTYVATVVEVQIDHSGKIRIPTVHMAVDCGQVIHHPDRVKAQLEGSAVWNERSFARGNHRRRWAH